MHGNYLCCFFFVVSYVKVGCVCVYTCLCVAQLQVKVHGKMKWICVCARNLIRTLKDTHLFMPTCMVALSARQSAVAGFKSSGSAAQHLLWERTVLGVKLVFVASVHGS